MSPLLALVCTSFGYALLVIILFLAFRAWRRKKETRADYEQEIEINVNGKQIPVYVSVDCIKRHKDKIDELISDFKSGDYESEEECQIKLLRAAREKDSTVRLSVGKKSTMDDIKAYILADA